MLAASILVFATLASHGSAPSVCYNSVEAHSTADQQVERLSLHLGRGALNDFTF